MNQQQEKIIPPNRPGEWSIKQIEAVLSRPFPANYLSYLEDKSKAPYVAWYRVNEVLSKYCPGWGWEIKETVFSSDRIYVTGCLSIPSSDGIISRCAKGSEMLKREKWNKQTNQMEILEIAYGDPASNAESKAFRRAAAKFGLGLYLYDKKKRDKYQNQAATNVANAFNGEVVEPKKSPSVTPRLCSQSQLSMLFALGRDYGLSSHEVKEIAYGMGYDSMKNIPMKDIDLISAKISSFVPLNDQEPYKSWSSEDDAISWAVNKLPEMTMAEITKRWRELPSSETKFIDWFNQVKDLIVIPF